MKLLLLFYISFLLLFASMGAFIFASLGWPISTGAGIGFIVALVIGWLGVQMD